MSVTSQRTHDWQLVLDDLVVDMASFIDDGVVAQSIPPLTAVDPIRFGVALVTVDGRSFAVGDATVAFSLQSVSKVFALVLAVHALGNTVWKRVGREPSGKAFDSLEQLEAEFGIPRNPFINAGALATTDILISTQGSSVDSIVKFLRTESGNPDIDVDETMAAAEAVHGHRNTAIANFMKAYATISNPVSAVTTEYFRQCAIRASCLDLSRAALILARNGVCHDGDQFLTPDEVRQINAVMLTCGTYDAVGDIASRVGLPCKSGIGGGVIAVIPGVGVLTVWSPRIDRHGNSVAGVEFLERFTKYTNCSIF